MFPKPTASRNDFYFSLRDLPDQCSLSLGLDPNAFPARTHVLRLLSPGLVTPLVTHMVAGTPTTGACLLGRRAGEQAQGPPHLNAEPVLALSLLAQGSPRLLQPSPLGQL